MRVKAQKPGDKRLQEVLYSTEAHTDRYFCSKEKDSQSGKHKGLQTKIQERFCVDLSIY